MLYWAIGFALFVYLTLRSYFIPITHDEAGTFLEYVVVPLQNTLLCIPASATNHIFHTLLVKCSTGLFGNQVFFIRLPVLLSYGLYFFFSLRLLQKLTTKPFWIVIGISFLNFHPYLLEFFSLSRGYGLGIAFMMGSIYYTFFYFNDYQSKKVIAALGFAALASYSNFVFGFYYMSLVLLFVVHSVVLTHRVKSMKLWVKHDMVVQIVGGASLVLALVTIVPLKNLLENKAFYIGGQTGFIADTLGSLIRWNLYGVQYFGNFDLQIIAGVLLPILLAAFLWAIIGGFLYHKPKLTGDLYKRSEISLLQNLKALQLFSALLVGVVGLQVLYVVLFEGKYAVGRTALYLLPLAMWLLFAFLWYGRRWLLVKTIAVFFAAMLTFHLLQTVNIRQSYEWGFDADTPAMLDFMAQQSSAQHKTLSLGVHWLMFPSVAYYRYVEGLPNVEVFSDKKLKPNEYNYYYIPEIEASDYLKNYAIVKRFGNGHILLLGIVKQKKSE
ncbi:MAG: hypothetical protein R3E32_25890 [Chitinophagales bacterium]